MSQTDANITEAECDTCRSCVKERLRVLCWDTTIPDHQSRTTAKTNVGDGVTVCLTETRREMEGMGGKEEEEERAICTSPPTALPAL